MEEMEEMEEEEEEGAALAGLAGIDVGAGGPWILEGRAGLAPEPTHAAAHHRHTACSPF